MRVRIWSLGNFREKDQSEEKNLGGEVPDGKKGRKSVFLLDEWSAKPEVILGPDLFGGQVVNALLYRFGS